MPPAYDTVDEATADAAVISREDSVLIVQDHANTTFFRGVSRGSITICDVTLHLHEESIRVEIDEG